jgi:hypothetical protein
MTPGQHILIGVSLGMSFTNYVILLILAIKGKL